MSDYGHEQRWHRLLMAVLIVAAALFILAAASLCLGSRAHRPTRRARADQRMASVSVVSGLGTRSTMAFAVLSKSRRMSASVDVSAGTPVVQS